MKTITLVWKCDQWLSRDSQELIGVFEDKISAINAVSKYNEINIAEILTDYNIDEDEGTDYKAIAAQIISGQLNEINQTQRYSVNYMIEQRVLNYIEREVDGYDLYDLNAEFEELLCKHEDDTDVKGASREHFLDMISEEDDIDIIQFDAMACNAWDELCDNNPGLSESGLNWWYGAEFAGFPNPYDLYVGTGDE